MLLASEVVALRQLVSTLLFVLLQSGLARDDTRCKELQGAVFVVGCVSSVSSRFAPSLDEFTLIPPPLRGYLDRLAPALRVESVPREKTAIC
jgi:hypothetical protein